MREFIVSLTLVSLITSICLMIMPEGGLKKYVKMALSLVFIVFAVSAFTASPSDGLSVPRLDIRDRTDELYDSVIKEAKKTTEKNLTDAIAKKFFIPKEDIEITVEFSGERTALEVSRVYIRIHGIKNAVKVTAVKKYAENMLEGQIIAEYAE